MSGLASTVVSAGSARVVRGAECLSVTMAVSVMGVTLLIPGWGRWSWMPLVVGLLIGLPHGALDHRVLVYRLGARAPALLGVLGAYVALAAAAYLAMIAEPAAGLAVFVALSVWHFGTGETQFAALRARGVGVDGDAVVAAAFGAVVVAVPLVSAPGDTAPVLALLVPGSSGRLPTWMTVGVPVLTAVLIAGAGVRLLRGRRHRDLVDLVTLCVLFVATPPLVAFGTYFGAWHSVRHLARLLEADPRNAADLAGRRVVRPLRRMVVDAAPPTVVTEAVVGGLWLTAHSWQRTSSRRTWWCWLRSPSRTPRSSPASTRPDASVTAVRRHADAPLDAPGQRLGRERTPLHEGFTGDLLETRWLRGDRCAGRVGSAADRSR